MTLERVTINLTTRSVAALGEVVLRAGLNKTEAINRAIQLYNALDEVQHSGGVVYVRDSADAGLERLRIL